MLLWAILGIALQLAIVTKVAADGEDEVVFVVRNIPCSKCEAE